VLTVVSQPSNGSLVVNPDGTLTYTHNNSYTAEDVFSYQLSNGVCTSNVAVVNVVIDVPEPQANADFISVNRGQSITYDIDANQESLFISEFNLEYISPDKTNYVTFSQGKTKEVTIKSNNEYFIKGIYDDITPNGDADINIIVSPKKSCC
jgi:hypothetical protein